MTGELRPRRVPWLVALVVALASTLFVVTPASVAGPLVPGDVYLRDNDGTSGPGWPTDSGTEPNPWGTVWNSPDIHVPTLAVGGNSIILVTLRNDGATPISGELQLFYTAQGTAATWTADWLPINAVPNVTVPAHGAVNVPVQWINVPGPGHFCLLARWHSPAQDPMTFPEAVGSNTYTNTKNNNNLAWKNADTVDLNVGTPVNWPVRVRDPLPEPARFNLVVAQGARPFVGPGRLVLDLGPTLARRWHEAGRPGSGVRPVGETQVEIVDPKRATIQGLLLTPDDQIDVKLGFTAGAAAKGGRFPVSIIQTDAQNTNVGGLELTAVVR